MKIEQEWKVLDKKMMTVFIDGNADIGEVFGRYTLGGDNAMLDLVLSVNLACSFHRGDP